MPKRATRVAAVGRGVSNSNKRIRVHSVYSVYTAAVRGTRVHRSHTEGGVGDSVARDGGLPGIGLGGGSVVVRIQVTFIASTGHWFGL